MLREQQPVCDVRKDGNDDNPHENVTVPNEINLPYKIVIPDEHQVLQDGEEMYLSSRVFDHTVQHVKHIPYISACRVKENSTTHISKLDVGNMTTH